MNPPVVIFAYNRPQNFKRLLDSLSRNKGIENHEIFVFIDGPRSDEDKQKVEEVKHLATELTEKVIASEFNKGLATSVISGVSKIINKYGSCIVLEDDLILHPSFLSYMTQGLEKYKNDNRILSICGYGLKVKRPNNYEFGVYGARRSSSWGWATWADRWNEIDWEVKDFEELKKSRKSRRDFNRGGSDMYSMLKGYIDGNNNSWAIRFCWHQAKRGLISIHPFRSLVKNEGFGEDASNCRQTYSRFKIDFEKESPQLDLNFPENPEINLVIDRNLRHYHSLPLRLYSFIRRIL